MPTACSHGYSHARGRSCFCSRPTCVPPSSPSPAAHLSAGVQLLRVLCLGEVLRRLQLHQLLQQQGPRGDAAGGPSLVVRCTAPTLPAVGPSCRGQLVAPLTPGAARRLSTTLRAQVVLTFSTLFVPAGGGGGDSGAQPERLPAKDRWRGEPALSSSARLCPACTGHAWRFPVAAAVVLLHHLKKPLPVSLPSFP